MIDSKLDVLTEKLRALMNKTTDRGCTEGEALAAADKVSELMDKYGLSKEQLQLDSAPDECEESSFNFNGHRKTHPVVMCMTTIGKYTSTQPWYKKGGKFVATYTFFGLPSDVKVACWLLQTFHSAMNLSYRIYADNYPGDFEVNGHTVRKAFMQGMGYRLIERLQELIDRRETPASFNGTFELMVLKEDNLAKALKNKKMKFRTQRLAPGDSSLESWVAGRISADSVPINSGELNE